MTTYNKIEQSVYTTILSHNVLADGSIQVEYAIGVGTDQDGQMIDFQVLANKWLTIQAEEATSILNAPMTKEDIGRTPNEIVVARIYTYLKNTNTILV